MYANDTTIFFTNTSLDALFRVANAELIKIAAWFYDDKLCINLNKTNFLVFNSNDYNLCNPHQLVLNHVVLEHKEFTKFLGVLIDANLNRKAHILNFSNRLTHNIALLKVAATCLPKSFLRTLYKAFFHSPNVCYTILVFYKFYCPSTCAHITKQAIRILASAHQFSNTKPY